MGGAPRQVPQRGDGEGPGRRKREAGDGKESFVDAVLGGEDLGTAPSDTEMQTAERLGYLRKNEERGLACSRLEGGGPGSLRGGGRGLLSCVLKTSLWNWR